MWTGACKLLLGRGLCGVEIRGFWRWGLVWGIGVWAVRAKVSEAQASGGSTRQTANEHS